MAAGILASTLAMVAVSLATQKSAPVPPAILAAMAEAARTRPVPPGMEARGAAFSRS
jgi:hypothetical protein